MFARLFRQKDNKKNEKRLLARSLYALALAQARKNVFYERAGVPDTFDGRFDLLILHLFLILHRAMGREDYKDLSQALFDVTFFDMDQTLREMGIGDMGVPKHMRKMMKAFNGRMHAYEDAIQAQDDVMLGQVLCRNVYDGNKDMPGGPILLDYVRSCLALQFDQFSNLEEENE